MPFRIFITYNLQIFCFYTCIEIKTQIALFPLDDRYKSFYKSMTKTSLQIVVLFVLERTKVRDKNVANFSSAV